MGPRSSRRGARGSRATSTSCATRSIARRSSGSPLAARSFATACTSSSRPSSRSGYRAGAPVPYLGQTGAAVSRVATADIDRFRTLLGGYGIDAGSAGPARNSNPLQNIFTRVDIAPSVNNRLVLRYNYGHAEDEVLARDPTLIRLTSNAHAFTSLKGSTVAQLFTSFEGGAGNELIVGYSRIRDRRHAAVFAPQVQVDVPTLTGVTARLRAGAENASQGTEVDQDIVELTDNVTFPLGRHRVTAGTKNEFYRITESVRAELLRRVGVLEPGLARDAATPAAIRPASDSVVPSTRSSTRRSSDSTRRIAGRRRIDSW